MTWPSMTIPQELAEFPKFCHKAASAVEVLALSYQIQVDSGIPLI